MGSLRIAKELGLRRRSVQTLIQKYKETGSNKDKPGRGRKRKLSTKEEKTIVKKAMKKKTASEMVREIPTKVSVSTVKRTYKKIWHMLLKRN